MSKMCPICGKEHELDLRTRLTNVIIKGIEVEYQEDYYVCPNKAHENEYATASMENVNLQNARNAYREKVGGLD